MRCGRGEGCLGVREGVCGGSGVSGTCVTGFWIPQASLSSSVLRQQNGPPLWQSVQAWLRQSVWLQPVTSFNLVE
ncbi:hypothetical protein E2C01_089831 [Portunus trituberculatus]|uniref:Uncharacterized protein n=1 Tax=Portunus trituberculatus TaxID=210409 RepID=A0A5B7JJV2_PORTR|nr:hypothetical protein [Portunus trituberculatus]